MKKVDANLSYELYVDCPHCDHNFDVMSDEYSDCDGGYSKPLFNNRWESINVIQSCPECDGEFVVESIVY
ncbi:hypothetical protein NVP1284A_63 [Vibrio phage 1.284.A._10N.286.55.A5]|nr:hypothetical protein NVP1284A_63 [Vibrio phage 1.284.A._10N.286.55.A5]AUS01636.1 hypothetical protein NVP1287O_63 [Vibrio phage 1.287.O._10N.286.55.C7]AUS01706.1 hypothetical protein NVP1289A_62 [Vibrio phage 1.289.A._10N.286.55.E8]